MRGGDSWKPTGTPAVGPDYAGSHQSSGYLCTLELQVNKEYFFSISVYLLLLLLLFDR